MNPDNETIFLWLDDELEGPALVEMEAWTQSQPQLLSRREELREWKQGARRVLTVKTIPAAEMFHASLARAIQHSADSTAQPTPASVPASTAAHQPAPHNAWFRYARAAALVTMGVGLGLMLATRSAAPEPATVYTPEQGVHANVNNDSPADATVIVLDGTALPDSTDIPEPSAPTPALSPSEMSQSLRLSP